MMNKQRGLGRGLNELLSEIKQPMSPGSEASVSHQPERLSVDLLQSGKYQPRRDIENETLYELAESILAQGVIQPIIVRPVVEGNYEIIAGERRWRAAQLAGLSTVPVIIRDIPDETAIVMALIENIQREDLNAMEEAMSLQRLIDEFGMTHEETARAVGKKRATISNLLRLLDLNEEVKKMLENGDLEMGHARALLPLSLPAQSEAAQIVVGKALSVRETEQLVKRLQTPQVKHQVPEAIDPDVRRLQSDLSDKLGTRVNIEHGNKGKGRLVIHYNNLDELDGILEHIK